MEIYDQPKNQQGIIYKSVNLMGKVDIIGNSDDTLIDTEEVTKVLEYCDPEETTTRLRFWTTLYRNMNNANK